MYAFSSEVQDYSIAIYCGQILLGIIILSYTKNAFAYEKSRKYASEIILK